MLLPMMKKYNTRMHRFILIGLSFACGTIHTKTTREIRYIEADDIYQVCCCDFCNEIRQTSSVKTYKENCTKKAKKQNKVYPVKRTIMIYMAADNDLRPFAARNIQQMDSGNPATLISFCEWAIKNYGADEYDLILWNHGTGILEPPHGKIINPMDLFVFNPSTHRFDLDRTVGFMDIIARPDQQHRGVCWDDSTGNYLSNRKMEIALQTICQNFLGGKKFGIIGFDACLMSMIEVSSFIKKYAHVMVSSEEVELGMGWKYDEVLFPFIKDKLDTFTFARHIVAAYERTYQTITNDYTLSAINLDLIELLERNVDQVSRMLLEGLDKQKALFGPIIKESRNKLLCTHFDEPTYIDLHHFYKNLVNNTRKFAANNNSTIKDALLAKLADGMQLIEQLVIANTTGKNLKNAQGIAIYFPERGIHNSYQEAVFLTSNAWGELLMRYIFG